MDGSASVNFLNPLGIPVDAGDVQALMGTILQGEHQRQSSTYFSTVMFQTALTGTFTYTVASGTNWRAFSYGIGADLSVVGFPSGTAAQFCDTNLATPNLSNNGDWVVVYGLALQPTPTSEPILVKQMDEVTSIIIWVGGNALYLLGNPSMVPGSNGYFGLGDSTILVPDQESYIKQTGALCNGNPAFPNARLLPTPILWAPAGKVDSTFNVEINCRRAAAYTTLVAADRAGVAGGASTPGTAAWTHPAATAVFVRYKAILFAQQINNRSANA